MKHNIWIILIVILAMRVVQDVQAQDVSACDHACLEGIADLYMNAMAAHDASQAPFADDLIFTENTVRLPPTEGLWFTASGLTDYKFYITDAKTGQVAWTGIVKEHDKPVLMSVRLKVVEREITEAESIVVRNLTERNLANLKAPPPGLADTLPAAERGTREAMLTIPDLYFAALAKLDDSEVPFADRCYRIENGMVTAGTFDGAVKPETGLPGSSKCANGKIPPMLKTIHNVQPRRTPIVDEERGMTWGVYSFNHRGLGTITMPDGSVRPSYSPTPNTMPCVEIFKTRGGRITDIFAIGSAMPYGIGDGWAGPLFREF